MSVECRTANCWEVLEHWIENLKDSRDFKTIFSFDASDEHQTTEERVHWGGQIPNSGWIYYNLWIDETWSALQRSTSLLNHILPITPEPPSIWYTDNPLTHMERALVPIWHTLGKAAFIFYKVGGNHTYSTEYEHAAGYKCNRRVAELLCQQSRAEIGADGIRQIKY